jgi:HTH-type transcriptional regulator/antitoxin HigA
MIAAEVFPPGEFLADEFRERGLSALDGVPEAAGIVAGTCEITAEVADRLGAALGTSPQFWLNLEVAWQGRP